MSNLKSQSASWRTNFKFFEIGYLLFVIGLFLYSFTQVDLGLTLTRSSLWQETQRSLQFIGYFQRPLSTGLFLGLIIGLFAWYAIALKGARRISRKQFWRLLIPITVILALSYNAFSYDLFNYIFDAKIFTKYNENPYLHKALDFPKDPMLSFMHWTHRTYPYGPVWLGLTIPLSFLGMQYFLPTFFLFKAFIAASFLGSVYFIGKILKKIEPEAAVVGMVLFALNPLVLVESLVSAHNDIVMMFFAIVSWYFLVQKKIILAALFLLLSIGVKFATIFLLPAFFLAIVLQRRKEYSFDTVNMLALLGMIAAIVGASLRTNFQPWYLLFVLPFAALLPKKPIIVIPTVAMSFFALLQYVPYLYLGNWDPPVPQYLFILTSLGIAVSFLGVLIIGRKVEK